MSVPFASTKQAASRDFTARHIGPDERDVKEMLAALGASSVDQLIEQSIPASIRQKEALSIGVGVDEKAALERMRELAERNQVFVSLIGQGYYASILPTVILRNVLENPAWYTAYTPYQPEISQGRLEALLNFQTLVADLTGLAVANASLLDEATAAAEAMAMAHRLATNKSSTFFVDENVHPQTLTLLRTRAEPLGWKIVVGKPLTQLDPSAVFGAIFQYPGSCGSIDSYGEKSSQLRKAGALSVFMTDLLALTLLTPPGELGADIAAGSAQRFGVPLGYGGPHAAFISCRDDLKRALPGRLVGVSVDSRGRPAYRLALQTREQHIRRDKATSNICTAQVLLAVIAAMYAVYHGPDGLRRIAEDVHAKASVLKAGLSRIGRTVLNDTFFDTITVQIGSGRDDLIAHAQAQKINFRLVGTDCIGISVDETTTEGVIERVWKIFGVAQAYADVACTAASGIPKSLRRSSTYLEHPVFNSFRSETEMLRYLRRLSDKDLALDRAMIPLGSCTMKLNATTEMIPVTFPGFGSIHPYAPIQQAAGYHEMFEELRRWLADLTGYDEVSLQPNSGAQGEYAGLLAIRKYHDSRGEQARTVCLIPSSAHGTNPASAQMAGMEVVVTKCDQNGNVDLEDLKAKVAQYAAKLAAIMVTYPSTHGVFEEDIVEICGVVHAAGGQVYLDGANLNAMVGLARPGEFGADVSHLNLHKTFCIPHGGGGPGMGPIGVKKHLAPFLPSTEVGFDQEGNAGAVSAAPYGSASILPVSYAYILMMGSAGLRRATEIALVSANYIATQLNSHFPILYRNKNGRVAHECIVDVRPLREKTGVTVEDIAKRLIDYGFHAPTMSFPVAGTLMIEPTESESKQEIDRFIGAMIAIRTEIEDVSLGHHTIEESPLRHAPHTVLDVCDETWNRKYSRSHGCLPAGVKADSKYWCASNRVDNAWGDRNLTCSCPPVSAYA